MVNVFWPRHRFRAEFLESEKTDVFSQFTGQLNRSLLDDFWKN